MHRVRPADEADIAAIQTLFRVCYGKWHSQPKLDQLLQQRRDDGVVLFRNLAQGLSSKLGRTDASLSIQS